MSTTKITLRPYQRKQIDAVYDQWRSGAKNVVYVLPTGGGKTVSMATIAHEMTTPGVAIAHRKELVSQISRALASVGVPHNIIAAENTVKSCITRHVALFGRSFYDPRARMSVASVDTLAARDTKLAQWANTVGLWLIDECFPAGTLVDGRPIETIRVGDWVTAFDETTGEFSKKPVVRLFKNPIPETMVRLDCWSHHARYSTHGHPFWTRRGWVNAGNLRADDEVLSVRKVNIAPQPIAKEPGAVDKSGVLQCFMRDGVSETAWEKASACGKSTDVLRDMQRNVFGETPDVRSTEGRISEWVRVESVSVVKRSDPDFPGSGHVYNIEVADLHTYTANGIVVHNCHHVLSDNKWGRAVTMFPNALGVGFTATPIRADKRSLARVQKGVFDAMVTGPTMRELITMGNLCDYRIFAPPSSIDRSAITVGSTGDFSEPSMRKVMHESKIVGDIVASYVQFASGKRGITFVCDVEQADEVATAYRAAGVRAECVSAKTPDAVREQLMLKFETGTIDQLVNVDLFGEGLDVPAVEVVSMGRPTESYGLYVQQFGRALRPLASKAAGIIIDHVGNVVRHGLPDSPRTWTLIADQRGKKTARDPDAISVTRCLECFKDYEAISACCPFCGFRPEPAGRGRPDQVAGDLCEIDPEVLRQMRGEVERIDGQPMIPYGASEIVAAAIRRNWLERQDAQDELRASIAQWAGVWKHRGAEDAEIYRRFYHLFGIDILSAQALNAADARELKGKL